MFNELNIIVDNVDRGCHVINPALTIVHIFTGVQTDLHIIHFFPGF